MDWNLELVAIPVSDVDRAKAFYTEKAGFNADHDHSVGDGIPLRSAHASGLGLLDRPGNGARGRAAGLRPGHAAGRLGH
jgi:catechol 2,3-dioxygenase-like lactoylglutathione lyase family enzyme